MVYPPEFVVIKVEKIMMWAGLCKITQVEDQVEEV